MANKPVTYEVEDTTTGKKYTIEGPEGATADELGSFIESQQSQPQPTTPQAEPTKEVAPVAPAVSSFNPALPRQEVANEFVQGLVDKQAQTDPRWLGPEGEATYRQMTADPKYSLADINEWIGRQQKLHGLPVMGVTGTQEDLDKLRESLKKPGVKLGGVQYVDWKESLPAPPSTVDKKINIAPGEGGGPEAQIAEEIWRNMQAGGQEGFQGILQRKMASWNDAAIPLLRQKFPDATDEQLQSMQEELIPYWQKGVREANEQATAGDNPVAQFAGKTVGSIGPEIAIPGGEAEGLLARTAIAAGVNAATDVGYQYADIHAGVQDEYNPLQTAAAVGIGAGIHLGVEGIHALGAPKGAQQAEANAAPAEAITTPTVTRRGKAYAQQIGQTVNGIINHVNSLTADWSNAPQVEVHANFNKIKGLDNTAIGVTSPEGKVLLNTEAILGAAKRARVAPEDVVSAVTYHEGLGHYGLSQKFGDNLDAVLTDFYDNGVSTFKERVDQYLEEHPNEYAGQPDQLPRIIEEVLARDSERGVVPVGLMDRVTNMIKEFGRAMGINLKYSDREIKSILGMAHNAVINGKPNDVVGNGFRFMNVGSEARHYGPEDVENFNKAWDMEAKGYTTNDIFDATGWWKGVDGEWRSRISDADASFVKAPNGLSRIEDLHNRVTEPGGTAWAEDLPNLFDHPLLYKAYPWLRDTLVVHEDSPYLGASSSKENRLYLNVDKHADLDALKATLLHEVQHQIQDHEGWATGGNADLVLKHMLPSGIRNTAENLLLHYSDTLANLDERIFKIKELLKNPAVNDLHQAFTDYFETERNPDSSIADRAQAFQKYQKLSEEFSYLSKDDMKLLMSDIVYKDSPLKHVDDLEKSRNDFVSWGHILRDDLSENNVEGLRNSLNSHTVIKQEAYQWLAGEVEARETEALRNYTQEQLSKVRPNPTKYHPDFQIVLKGDKIVAHSMPDEGRPKQKVDPRFIREDTLKRRSLRKETGYWKSYDEWAAEYGIDPVTRQPLPFSDPAIFDKRKYMREFTAEQDAEQEIHAARTILTDALDNYQPTIRSWDEGKRAARQRGLTAKQIRSAKSIGELDKRIFQYDAVADKVDQKLTKLHNKIDTGDFNMNDKGRYLETVFQYNQLLGHIFDDQAEIGRALNAMKAIMFTRRKLGKLNDLLADMHDNVASGFADDETFYKFAREVKAALEAGNKEGAHNLLQNAMKPYWWQYILSFRHSMMLSSMGTQAKNAVDNVLMVSRELEEAIMSTPGFFIRKGLRAGGLNVKEGTSPQELAGRMYGLLRAAFDSETYAKTWEALQKGHSADHTKLEMGDARIPGLSKIQDVLHASDTLLRAFHTNTNLYALGVRQAREEGFRGVAALEEGSNKAAHPTPEMIDEAKNLADVALLVDRPFLSRLEALKAVKPNMGVDEQIMAFGANLLFPFFRVSDRLIFQKLRRSPLAFLDRVTREDLKAGGPRRDIAVARMLYGSALIYYYWQAAGQGKVVGRDPADPAKRQALQAGGYQQNSVVEDGKYVDATALNLSFTPSDLHNSVAANVASIRQAYDKTKDANSAADGLGNATLALMSVLSSESFANNISMYTEPFQNDNEGTTDAALGNLGGSLASSFLPGGAAMRQANREFLDTTRRDTTGDKSVGDRIVGRIKADIPGLSKTLPPKYDAYGDPMQYGQTFFGMRNYQNIKNDPVAKELTRLEKSSDKTVVAAAPSTIQQSDINPDVYNKDFVVKIDGDSIKLNAAAKEEWQRVQGYYLRMGMSQEIQSPDWKKYTDAQKILIVKDVRKDAYEATKQYMLPQLGLQEQGTADGGE